MRSGSRRSENSRAGICIYEPARRLMPHTFCSVRKNRPDVTNPDKVFGVRQRSCRFRNKSGSCAAALQMQRRNCDGSTRFATDQRRFFLRTHGTHYRRSRAIATFYKKHAAFNNSGWPLFRGVRQVGVKDGVVGSARSAGIWPHGPFRASGRFPGGTRRSFRNAPGY
jgi:hypothetical protein